MSDGLELVPDLRIDPDEVIDELLAVMKDVSIILVGIVNETEDHTFGRSNYDMTLDHLHDESAAALRMINGLRAWGYDV